jgi:hypothetical protein
MYRTGLSVIGVIRPSRQACLVIADSGRYGTFLGLGPSQSVKKRIVTCPMCLVQ